MTKKELLGYLLEAYHKVSRDSGRLISKNDFALSQIADSLRSASDRIGAVILEIGGEEKPKDAEEACAVCPERRKSL